MNSNDEKIPQFDDIIFESRNKEYGAYVLRKKYNAVVLGGMLVSVFLGILAVIIPFILSQ